MPGFHLASGYIECGLSIWEVAFLFCIFVYFVSPMPDYASTPPNTRATLKAIGGYRPLKLEETA